MFYLILQLFNLLCSGILAGLEIAIHYGIQKPTAVLDDRSQIILRQKHVRTFRWLVPGFFIPTMLTCIVLTLTNSISIAFYFRLAATVAVLLWIAVRVIRTVGINSASIDWNPDDPPRDWKSQIAKAEKFHIIGTWSAIVTFLCVIIAAGIANCIIS